MSNISANYLTELACKIKAGNSLLSQILRTLTSTFEVDGTKCDDTISTTQVFKTVQTVPHSDFIQKVQICSSSQKDPEVVCISNDGGNTVVSGWEVFNISEDGTVSSTIYLNGVDVTGIYFVVPCGEKSFDIEFRTVCVNGEDWTQIFVFDKSVSLIAPIQIGWLNAQSISVSAPDISLINNINCSGCNSTPLGVLTSWG